MGKLIREGKTQTYEVTPRRRKSTQFSVNVNVNDPRTFAFQVVRPGAVTAYEETLRLSAQPELMITTNRGTAPPPTLPSAGEAGIPKRLDELDAEIKQLRKAIEELSKALARQEITRVVSFATLLRRPPPSPARAAAARRRPTRP